MKHNSQAPGPFGGIPGIEEDSHTVGSVSSANSSYQVGFPDIRDREVEEGFENCSLHFSLGKRDAVLFRGDRQSNKARVEFNVLARIAPPKEIVEGAERRVGGIGEIHRDKTGRGGGLNVIKVYNLLCIWWKNQGMTTVDGRGEDNPLSVS
jgi:hypothetical protein